MSSFRVRVLNFSPEGFQNFFKISKANEIDIFHTPLCFMVIIFDKIVVDNQIPIMTETTTIITLIICTYSALFDNLQ